MSNSSGSSDLPSLESVEQLVVPELEKPSWMELVADGTLKFKLFYLDFYQNQFVNDDVCSLVYFTYDELQKRNETKTDILDYYGASIDDDSRFVVTYLKR